jgi:hypothetical protein
MYLVLAMGSFGAMMLVAFVIVMSGLAFHVNEILDAATVLHFLRDSAFFRPIRPHTMHIQEELDKKKIHDVHQETSDKPFPNAGKQKRLLTGEEVHKLKQEMAAAANRTIRSRRFDEEIALMKAGSPADLSDGWKVYTFDHTLHDLYGEMSGLRLDPGIRTLRFRLNISEASEKALQVPMYLYQLKQDLYHLFQVLNTDPWLASYNRLFEHMTAFCYGIEPDSFGHVQLYAFMKIDIARFELHQREGKFFNAADLHKICTLTFNNGKPLLGEQL